MVSHHTVNFVSHPPANFDGHGHCGSADIMVLVCLVISPDCDTKRSSNSIGRSPLTQVTILPSLVRINNLVVEI